MESEQRTKSAWRIPILYLVFSLLVVGGFFWQTFADIVRHWTASTAYNHGFLIPLIVAYLIYDRFGDLRQLSPRPAWLALVFVSGSLIFWLIGTVADARVIQQFALVALIQWSFVAILGWRIGWALAFPLFYLFFAVPFGDFLNQDLQNITAIAVVKLLQLTGIPVFYEGIFISVPTGNFKVAEACNGLRFLLAAIAIGALMANMMLKQFWRRALFVALTIIVPIAANGLRAYGIIMLAYATNNKIAIGFDHIIYGWVFISLVLLALLGFGYLLRERETVKTEFAPVVGIGGSSSSKPDQAGLAIISCMIIGLSFASAGVAQFLLSPPKINKALAVTHLETSPSWQIKPSINLNWKPTFPNADQLLLRSYRMGDEQVDVAIAYYRWQRDGAEIVGWQNKMVSSKNWQWLADGDLEIEATGNSLNTRYNLFRSQNTNRVTVQFYYVAGRITGSARLAKLYQIETLLLGKSPGAASVVFSTEYTGDPTTALKRLQFFAADIRDLGLE